MTKLNDAVTELKVEFKNSNKRMSSIDTNIKDLISSTNKSSLEMGIFHSKIQSHIEEEEKHKIQIEKILQSVISRVTKLESNQGIIMTKLAGIVTIFATAGSFLINKLLR